MRAFKFLLLMIALFSSPIYAKDCGVVGDVYPIAEEDFVVFIKKQLNAIKGTPKYNQLQQKLKDGVDGKVDRPHPVEGITVTQTPKTFTVDPSIVLSEPLVNAHGQVILPAGSSVNPLSKMTLHSTLLFYNADDPSQVEWVKNKMTQNSHVKLILVGGSVHSQVEAFKQAVYFDQEGRLTNYFQITHAPAMVKQKDLLLRVSEEKA